MCAVSRVLPELQERHGKNAETEASPSDGEREERPGAEPASETQLLSIQVP